MSTRLRSAVAVAVVLAMLAAAGLWWFFAGDPPEEVTLETATGLVADDGGDDAATDNGDSDAADAEVVTDETAVTADGVSSDQVGENGLDGTWTVDAETGEFDDATSTGSFVGFRIEEELTGLGSTTAVGRTGEVAGRILIEDGNVTEATFEVDMTTITTNDSRRDDNVQDALETDRFPLATFVLTSPIELGPDAAAGEPVAASASGDLTVHGVSRAVSIPIEAQLVDDIVVVVGSTELIFADFGVTVPSSPIVLSVSDRGPLELQLLLTRS